MAHNQPGQAATGSNFAGHDGVEGECTVGNDARRAVRAMVDNARCHEYVEGTTQGLGHL
jgi:hypothetical protein